MLRNATLDPPRSFGVTGLDVLASDQRKQSDQLGLVVIEFDTVDSVEHRHGVVDEPGRPARTGAGLNSTRTMVCRSWPRSHRRPAQLHQLAESHGGPGGSSTPTASPCPGSPRPHHRPTLESSARRVLFANTFVSAITSRTASKIRSGRSDRRSLLRHRVTPFGWNPGSVIANPARDFQRRSVASACNASRSDNPSSDSNTSTVTSRSAGCDGRPRPDGNRSANMSSGNSRCRCSARTRTPTPPGSDAYTERRHHRAAHGQDQTFPASPNFRPPRGAREPFQAICQQSPSPGCRGHGSVVGDSRDPFP